MAFQSRARKLPSLLDGKLQEFRNAGRRKEKGRDQAGSLKLAAYSISKWPIEELQPSFLRFAGAAETKYSAR